MQRLAPFTCCLIIVFTILIDEGNGKWKSKNRENLQKDIAKFQEMAEKIEDEIEDVYDEYSDSWVNNEEYSTEKETFALADIDDAHNNIYKNNVNILNLISNYTNDIAEVKGTAVSESTSKTKEAPRIDTVKITTTEEANTVRSKWPKFEDILLDMGKKYDWKNDRWIKVKKKANQSSEEKHLETFHERHFSYKTVKLNRSKSRRNVVIAVTAVR
ncbi:uncharacterized protein LOC125233580 [Leguminivora glycinivorella]|uniref:uncharacterized protein LOC125233580 n=1 Tax=Leguminivora glycinivorella TaxID=1035111 RepID=UPI00200D3C31|nr:uncharacterized protein LOC125233580 [Leguminivora glycinivorella]